MEELLNQIQLSEFAIKMYLKSLGRTPLSSFELYSIVSNISPDNFKAALDELVEIGLLVPIPPQKKGGLSQYLAIPPFNPITKYYANINANLDNIKKQLRLLLKNSLEKALRENTIIELDSLFDKTHEVRNDYQEDVLIQKQEIDDIVYGMENLNLITNIFNELNQSIKAITQTHFKMIIKLTTNIKKEIIEKIELLELKKYESEVKYIIEQVFQDQFEKMMEDSIGELHNKIEKEFTTTIESLKNIINSIFQLRNDFKMLLLNMLNGFENSVNKIMEIVKDKKDGLSVDLEEFEKIILENIDAIIKNSVDSVTALNHPIEKAMKNYFKAITSEITLQFENLVNINSVSRVNESIKNIMSNSVNEVLLVVPKLEEHLNIEDFETKPNTLKVKIVSSEAHTNSLVKKYKEIKNLEYRTLLNDNIIILINDNHHILLGTMQESSSNTLQDFVGFETNYLPLVKLLDPITKGLWNNASTDLLETPKSISTSSPAKETEFQKDFKPVKAINSFTGAKKPEIKENILNKSLKDETKKQIVEMPTSKSLEPSEIIPNLAEELKEQISFTSKIIPASDDTVGLEIDNAFNSLLKKLSNMKGEEFSEELDKISELILEKKGFSVTLHKIRSKINQYRNQISTLSELDINHIRESITEWKTKLL
ncbi:MAG: hypothetical protein EAX89_11130 [Candidatus Lokiarchaeota archaeon]|nr:hypothetical protein [Candidatus Lokiarchaeota archaeon]